MDFQSDLASSENRCTSFKESVRPREQSTKRQAIKSKRRAQFAMETASEDKISEQWTCVKARWSVGGKWVLYIQRRKSGEVGGWIMKIFTNLPKTKDFRLFPPWFIQHASPRLPQNISQPTSYQQHWMILNSMKNRTRKSLSQTFNFIPILYSSCSSTIHLQFISNSSL